MIPSRRSPSVAPDVAPTPQRSIQWLLEVVVVFLLTLLPAALTGLIGSNLQGLTFKLQCGLFTLRFVQSTALLLYLMWRSGESWKQFGLQRPSLTDLSRAFGLLLASLLLGCFLAFLLFLYRRHLGQKGEVSTEFLNWFALPSTSIDWFILPLTCIGIGFSEELVVRGFLLVRFEQLLKSTWIAIALSSALFGLAHSYKSFLAATATGVGGALYGFAFTRWRRLWPLVVAHSIQDFGALALLVVLNHRHLGPGG